MSLDARGRGRARLTNSRGGADTGYHGFPQWMCCALSGPVYGHVRRDRARERTSAIGANPKVPAAHGQHDRGPFAFTAEDQRETISEELLATSFWRKTISKGDWQGLKAEKETIDGGRTETASGDGGRAWGPAPRS